MGDAALDKFADRLGTASWFSVVGESLSDAETVDSASYLSGLGMVDTETREVASWAKVEACIKATDWNSDWWDTEEQLRQGLLEQAQARLGEGTTLEALTKISERVSDVIHGAAAVAAARDGVADAGLIRAAAGAATMACYQAAVAAAANVANNNSFMAKYRLFEAGHWPLCVRGQAFYVF